MTPVGYDKRKYRRRNRIEIMFGRLRDWRRVATCYDRCPTVFFFPPSASPLPSWSGYEPAPSQYLRHQSDEIFQTRQNTKAARRVLTRLLKRQGLHPMRIM